MGPELRIGAEARTKLEKNSFNLADSFCQLLQVASQPPSEVDELGHFLHVCCGCAFCLFEDLLLALPPQGSRNL